MCLSLKGAACEVFRLYENETNFFMKGFSNKLISCRWLVDKDICRMGAINKLVVPPTGTEGFRSSTLQNHSIVHSYDSLEAYASSFLFTSIRYKLGNQTASHSPRHFSLFGMVHVLV